MSKTSTIEQREPRLGGLAHLLADPETAAVLRQRAADLARRRQAKASRQGELYIRFRLGPTEAYGIPHAVVEEVVSVTTIARVPCTPPMIAGVINRRGQMLPVLDLRQLFRLQGEMATPLSIDIIIVSAAGLVVGMKVDELIGNAEYAPDALGDVLPTEGPVERSHVLGLVEGKITILNVEKMLADLSLQDNE